MGRCAILIGLAMNPRLRRVGVLAELVACDEAKILFFRLQCFPCLRDSHV